MARPLRIEKQNKPMNHVILFTSYVAGYLVDVLAPSFLWNVGQLQATISL